MSGLELRTFTEEEYHVFFRRYQPDPLMDPSPFRYNREQISRSYAYNHGGYRENYVHFGVFLDNRPVGSFQLKRMDPEKKQCEFGIILQDDSVKNKGIGTEAIRAGMKIARDQYGMETIIGDTMGRNRRMMHVFEKLGFSLTEMVPGAFELPDGSREDRYVYTRTLKEDD
ncbi:MAG: GNAT family N-acetyltransferase [Clostridia bacterium]|nr:GNAT family N-acetyltransferase [Clostridia bacterium]